MIYLNDLFWILVIIFAIIGLFRGAAKELLVALSVLVSLFFNTLISTSTFIQGVLAPIANGMLLFALQNLILFFLILAGYQTPLRGKLPLKDRLHTNPTIEKILGGIVGGLNGFLIFGTFWLYMHNANYPIKFIIPPQNAGPDVLAKTMELIKMFPAYWLKPNTLYFVIGIAITIVLVLYV